MQEHPRPPGTQILTAHRLARVVFHGATMMVGTLGIFIWALNGGNGPAHAITLSFTTFVLFQFFNVFNARAEYGTTFNTNFFRNGKLWLALGSVIGLQVVAVYWPPAREIFSTVPLSLPDWLAAVAVASSILVVEELRKLVWRGRP